MSESIIKERVCDACDKTVQGSGKLIGGSYWSGWFKVEKTVGNPMFGGNRNNGPWDFCGVYCMCEFFDREENRA